MRLRCVKVRWFRPVLHAVLSHIGIALILSIWGRLTRSDVSIFVLPFSDPLLLLFLCGHYTHDSKLPRMGSRP